ncbi:MAG TPA: apolipoprotein N-acyltransferase [bacterium]
MSAPLGFLLSAVLGILSFPPVGIWPLSYVALIPFLASCVALPPKRARRWAYLGGFVFFAGLLYWLGLNSGAPPMLSAASVVVVVLILSTVWSITAGAVSLAARRFGLVTAMILFVVLYLFFEVFWGTGELGFPWALWGLTQIGFLPAAQLADLGDVYGLSLWVVSLNALLFLLWKIPARRKQIGLITALTFVVPLLYGIIRLSTFSFGPPVQVAAVQANTPVEEKWEMSAEDIAQSYLKTSAPLVGTGTRLVVWPETATPTPLRYRQWLSDELHTFCDGSNMTLLTGATDYEQDSVRGMVPLNSAFLIRPGTRELLSSAKIHLVPFGERIPAQKIFPFLHRLHLGQAEWEPGKSVVVFPPNNGIPASGCLICFEVVFPDLAADMTRGGARLLTTITNDGWYGNSSGPYQHLDLARLRAIAVRRSIVRSANTGISALILPTGAMSKTLGYNRAGEIHGTVPEQTEITLAAWLAHIWLPFYGAILLLTLVVLWIKVRHPRTSRPVL